MKPTEIIKAFVVRRLQSSEFKSFSFYLSPEANNLYRENNNSIDIAYVFLSFVESSNNVGT